MAFRTELSLGPFVVDTAGRLRPHKPEAAPGFTVRWRGQTTRARLGDGTLVLEARLGRVPSTASAGAGPSTGPRERALAALRSLPASLPPAWRLCLAADHRVRIETEQTLETPLTAVGLVTEVTRFLLQLDPILSRLNEAGIAGGAAPVATG